MLQPWVMMIKFSFTLTNCLKELEELAIKLKKDEHSNWTETENGWYIIQLKEITEPRLIEYKDCQEQISTNLRDIKTQEKLKDYIDALKKDSFIKIIKPYNSELK